MLIPVNDYVTCVYYNSLSNTMKTMQRDRVKNTINQSSWNPKIYSVNPQESRKRETKEWISGERNRKKKNKMEVLSSRALTAQWYHSKYTNQNTDWQNELKKIQPDVLCKRFTSNSRA